jgi:hypothetical protein
MNSDWTRKTFYCPFCKKELNDDDDEEPYWDDSYGSFCAVPYCNEECWKNQHKIKCVTCFRTKYYRKDGCLHELFFPNKGIYVDMMNRECNECYEYRMCKKFICDYCEEYIRVDDGLIVEDRMNLCKNCYVKRRDNDIFICDRCSILTSTEKLNISCGKNVCDDCI